MGLIETWKNRIAKCKRDISEYDKQKDNLQDEVNRLGHARNELSRCKDGFSAVRNKSDNIIGMHYVWKGNTREDYNNHYALPLRAAYKACDAKLYEMLGILDREIKMRTKEIEGISHEIKMLRIKINDLQGKIADEKSKT